MVRSSTIVVVLLLSGCAWTGQQVNLSPNIDSRRTPVVSGRMVLIQVDDERPSKILGHKAPAGGGEITAIQDPAVVVRDALARGSRSSGSYRREERRGPPSSTSSSERSTTR
jgi:uncharacterized lipoprotein YajG